MVKEVRKVISFGKSSFVVSLPKKWVTRHNVEKGSVLYLSEHDNSIILTTHEQPEDEEKSITIDIKDYDSYQIQRLINSAYISNYREIKLVGKNLRNMSEQVLDIIHNLIALEVLEFDSTQISTKDFLDMNKIDIIEIVRKMDIVTRSMVKDMLLCFEDDLSKNIKLRDKDVNRLSYLNFRAIRYALEHQSAVLKKYDLRAKDLLNLYWTAYHLEQIADEAKRISRSIIISTKAKDYKIEIETILENLKTYYLSAFKYLISKERTLAIKLSTKKRAISDSIDDLYFKVELDAHGYYLLDRARRMLGSIHELNRLTYQRVD